MTGSNSRTWPPFLRGPQDLIPYQTHRSTRVSLTGATPTEIAASDTSRVSIWLSFLQGASNPRFWPEGGGASNFYRPDSNGQSKFFLFQDWGFVVGLPWFADADAGTAVDVLEVFYRPRPF